MRKNIRQYIDTTADNQIVSGLFLEGYYYWVLKWPTLEYRIQFIRLREVSAIKTFAFWSIWGKSKRTLTQWNIIRTLIECNPQCSSSTGINQPGGRPDASAVGKQLKCLTRITCNSLKIQACWNKHAETKSERTTLKKSNVYTSCIHRDKIISMLH